MHLQCLTPGTSDRRTTFNQPDIASVADTAPDFADETSGQTEYECRVPESEKLEGLLRECLQLLQESVSLSHGLFPETLWAIVRPKVSQ